LEQLVVNAMLAPLLPLAQALVSELHSLAPPHLISPPPPAFLPGLCDPLKDLIEANTTAACKGPGPDPLPYVHSHPARAHFFEPMWVI